MFRRPPHVMLALIVSGGLWLGAVTIPIDAQRAQTGSPGEWFQEAVTLMEARGDCRAASPLFVRVADAPELALAARALVYLGVCHERLGRAEAGAAYQRVIDQFPEQRAAVAEARRRLAALKKPAAARPALTPTLRRTWRSVPSGLHRGGAVSADGRTFAYVNRAGHVVLGDLATGSPIRTVAADTNGTVGQRPIPSPQGQWIAYIWQPAHGVPAEVRMSRATSEPSRVVFRTRPGEAVLVHDWRVPSSLLLEVTSADGLVSLLLVEVESGQQRKVADVDAAPLSAKHSPDGRFVVYDAPGPDGDGRDLVVVASEGGLPTYRLASEADDFAPGWGLTADRLLFVSDRAGTASLWTLPLRDGRPSGPAAMVQRDIGVVINLLGITATGALHYNREVGWSDVYVQALDDSGHPSGEPWSAGGLRVGGNSTPSFAPDGKSVVFVTQISQAQIASYTRLAQCDVATRQVGDIRTDLSYLVQRPRWSPDGNVLLLRGAKNGRYGYFDLDVATGVTEALATVPYAEDRTLGGARWLDARTFMYQWIPQPAARTRVLRRVSIDSRQQDDWITFDDLDNLVDAVPAPGDHRLALILDRRGRSSVVIREPDGSFRSILDVPARHRVLSVAWMPDGRSLLYTQQVGTDRTASLWRLPVTGGPPEPIGIAAEGMRDLAVSPDGRAIAWTAGYPFREPWVLENVVPAR